MKTLKILKNNKGVTLVELLTSIVLAGIVINMVFMSYLFFQKQWFKAQTREDVQMSLLIVNQKLRKSINNSVQIIPTSSSVWQFQEEKADSIINHSLVYRDSVLSFDNIPFIRKGLVDSFSMHIDTAEIAPWSVTYYIRIRNKNTPLEIICRAALASKQFK